MTTERSTSERIALIGIKARLVARAGVNAASASGVKRAFRELSQILHPDQPGGNRASFELLVQAKDQLLAEIARAAELRERAALAPTQSEPRRELQ